MGSTKAMQVMWPREGLWLLARCGHSEGEWLSRFGVCLFVSYIRLLSKIYIFKKIRWFFLKKKKF